MNKALFAALDMLESEKGIPKSYMFEKLETALASAFRKEMGGITNVRVHVNEAKYDFKVYKCREVVENVENPLTQISLEDAKNISKRHKMGSVVEEEFKPNELRRLSAIAGKQVIIQAIREAERGILIREYEEKKEDIITATVDRIEPDSGNVRLNMGNWFATLLKDEQIPGETFEYGQTVKVFVIEVKKDVKDSRGFISLSRTNPGIVKRLFELNIPEIADGTVVIMSVAREAGSRTKIAVMSRDENVDPIGACVGPQNQRKTVITEELNGEKIDIIKYSENIEEYVKGALAPAVINGVTVEKERSCRVIVSPEQFSLAIGKEGQNARLAAKLTGMKIDIKSE